MNTSALNIPRCYQCYQCKSNISCTNCPMAWWKNFQRCMQKPGRAQWLPDTRPEPYLLGLKPHFTMCTLCSLSSSQPNKLRHILKFVSWYPIQHIFVPACSIARNSYKKMFLWTSNSKSEIFSKMYPSVQWTLGYIFGMLTVYPTWATKYTPVSHIGGILDTGVHDCTNSTLCNVESIYNTIINTASPLT